MNVLVVIDEFTRECLAAAVGRTFTARDVMLTLQYLFANLRTFLESSTTTKAIHPVQLECCMRLDEITARLTDGRPFQKTLV